MGILNAIGIVLERKKYLVLFISMLIIFSLVYIFAWNLVLLPNLYIRTDLWTLSNIFFLFVISILSSMTTTLGIFNLKMKMAAGKGGFFAIIPALLTSACPGCASLLLSFTSATFAIGLALAQFGTAIKILTILLLSITIVYLTQTISKCNIIKRNKFKK